MAGMRAARPGAYECEVKAAIEAVYPQPRRRCHGAIRRSSAAVRTRRFCTTRTASGRCRPASCCWSTPPPTISYMSGDITRTYPVSGTLLAAAARTCIRSCSRRRKKASASPAAARRSRAVHDEDRRGRQGGTPETGPDYRYARRSIPDVITHGAGHYIGIDVHDVGDRKRPLVPGMAFTIEPGIYIRQSVARRACPDARPTPP